MLNTKTLLTALVVSLLSTACGSQKPEDQVKSAKEYLQKQDGKSALIQLKNALQQEPDLGEARFLMGTILLQEGDAAGAEVEFRKALEVTHPESVVVPELARALVKLGQGKKLIEEFGTTSLEKPGAQASLQTSLSQAYANLGQTDESETALRSALTADPNYVPALIFKARKTAEARDFIGALKSLDEILEKDPKNSEAWKFKGDILQFASKRIDDAIVAYRKSVEFSPTYVPAYISVITALAEKKEFEEASKLLIKLKTFASKNPETKFLEALLAYERKDFKSARPLAQELVRLASSNPRVLQLAGAIEFQSNSLAQAEIYLVRATEADPQNAMSQNLLVTTYLRSGQPGKALAALKAITGKNGLDPRFFSLAGQVHLQNGDPKTAEEYFTKALKVDPTSLSARTALAVTQLRTGQSDNALNELKNIADTDKGATADMALISALLGRKDFDQALIAVNRLEAKQPEKPFAANLRGRIQMAMKDTLAARKSFERALAIDPAFFASTVSLSALDMFEKKPIEAKRRFERLLEIDPKNGQALLALANLMELQGANKSEVTNVLKKAVEANPGEVPPRLQLMKVLLASNDLKSALAAAQSAVQALPQNAEMLSALGRIQQLSGDLSQAKASYQKLILMQPNSPQPLIRLAEVQSVEKNYAAAEESLRKALIIKPDEIDAQSGLIVVFLRNQKYSSALDVAHSVQRQRPSQSLGFLMEGDIALSENNWDEALTAYRSALKRDPNAAVAAIKLHSALLMSGKKAESKSFSETWLKDHPGNVAMHSHLGDLAIREKDYPSAETNYSAALKSAPDNALVLNNLAWVLGKMKNENALSYAEKANDLAPNQPNIMDTLGTILADKGDTTRAIQLMTRALEIQPSNAELRLNLARIYIQSGNKVEAKKELKTLSKLGEKSTVYPEVSSLMKSLSQETP
ncbi:MAG: PEP-CTERM system TPR-repeat protein PrsT [Burkholderiaceae bacterium]|nr:PEP-CTERM system TPR-repeat protein PrsT [Burkholderiaceae bacterium]